MKNGFAKLVLGAAATLCIAAPGYSSALLDFSGLPNNPGSATVNPATGLVTALSVPYTQLVYNSTDYTLDSASLSLSGNTLTLMGEVFNAGNTMALTGFSTVETLVTIQLQSPLTNSAPSAQLSSQLFVDSAAASSVTVNTQLLTDLAIPASGAGSLSFIYVNGSSNNSNFSYSVASSLLDVQQNTSTVPEPVSFVICGGGLTALLFLKRGSRRTPRVRN